MQQWVPLSPTVVGSTFIEGSSLFQSSTAQYCVDQLIRKESFTGESITIPCSFTYPEPKNLIAVSLAVKASKRKFCGDDTDIIYNSSKTTKFTQHAERLSVQYKLGAKTSSLTIKDLMKADEQIYCCRLRVQFSNGNSIPWQNLIGTTVVVKGEKEMVLEQENFIFALPGDTVTIIARFTFKNQTTNANVTKCNVFMSTEDNGCEDEIYRITCAQRTNENIVFFKIKNSDYSHNGFYCYSIEVSLGEYNYVGRNSLRSQLLVLKPIGVSIINQTTEVEFSGPIIINCNFSVQDIISAHSAGDGGTLSTQVYWMVGEPREHFVYHPNEDYILPEYRGKTKLVGQSDLLLEDFPGPDNITLYCRVAIRFCSRPPPPNFIDSILEEGPGTLIRVQDGTVLRSQFRLGSSSVTQLKLRAAETCFLSAFL
ncbi:uncharacterized protein LOC142302809 [Anomaloglossus baeobatrachus]|uniref:uncharacterized protein LOC142302809 n=1 Tax=Anomaloglossus baeobatrachus TaxID=238106 RepID=UPI003F4F4109